MSFKFHRLGLPNHRCSKTEMLGVLYTSQRRRAELIFERGLNICSNGLALSYIFGVSEALVFKLVGHPFGHLNHLTQDH